MASTSHGTILLLIAQNRHLPKVHLLLTHAPKFFFWLKQSIKVKVERDTGLSYLSLIFTEPACGGDSHPDLGTGKGSGNPFEVSIPDWSQYRVIGMRAWKVAPFFGSRNLECLGPRQLLILQI